MTKRRLTALLVLAATACAVSADVTIEKDGDKLTSVKLTSSKGGILIQKKLWGNTVVTSESGKTWRVIDPFMYSSHARPPDGRDLGGYWSKPEVFETWKVEEVKDPDRAEATIVRIAAEQPELPLRKEAAIAVEADRNVAYVQSRLSALDDVHELTSDRQTIYLYKPGERYTIWADGKEIVPEDGLKLKVDRYMLFQDKRDGTSTAVVFLPRSAQKYPGSSKAPLGLIYFYIDEKRNGADCYWHKGGGKMAQGDTRVQKYVLVWGDGDLRQMVEELAKQAQAGELNEKIPELP